mgnify:CR=1 FL=1
MFQRGLGADGHEQEGGTRSVGQVRIGEEAPIGQQLVQFDGLVADLRLRDVHGQRHFLDHRPGGHAPRDVEGHEASTSQSYGAPFTAEDLARNFERIALFEEFTTLGGRLVAQETESRLHRWDRPVRLDIEIGPTVDPARATRDRNAIRAYADRLSRLTGLPIFDGLRG